VRTVWRSNPDWMLTDDAGIRIFTRDTKLLRELVKEAQDQFAKANQPYVVVHLADVVCIPIYPPITRTYFSSLPPD
jgi:hypothetical protein